MAASKYLKTSSFPMTTLIKTTNVWWKCLQELYLVMALCLIKLAFKGTVMQIEKHW